MTQKKASRKDKTEKVVLATAIISLISTLCELIIMLVEAFNK